MTDRFEPGKLDPDRGATIHKKYMFGDKVDIVLAVMAFFVFMLVAVAAIVIPNITFRHDAAKGAKARADLATLRSAIDQFRLDCDRYPTEKEGLQALYAKPKDLNGWHGPYLQKPFGNDPWRHPYVYRANRSRPDTYEVISFGADGKLGGEGEDADIVDGSD